MSRVQLALNVADSTRQSRSTRSCSASGQQRPARVRELRDRRAAAEARTLREGGVRAPQPSRRRGGVHRRGRRAQRRLAARARHRRRRTAPVATPYRTRSGSTTRRRAVGDLHRGRRQHHFGESSAHVDDAGDSLCCATVPEAQARLLLRDPAGPTPDPSRHSRQVSSPTRKCSNHTGTSLRVDAQHVQEARRERRWRRCPRPRRRGDPSGRPG